MKRPLFLLIIWCGVLTCLTAWADPVRQLYWDDLVPAHLLAEDPLAHLTPEQQDMAYWVINMLETLPKRDPETEEDYQEVDEAMPILKKAGIDITAILAKRKELRTAVDETLNGQTVRIPGYLLPLETSAGKVTEFLLVPYVGACIHVPPPPPNQIVHVSAIRMGGYKKTKLFDPVWVTGKIAVKSMVKELFLVDGSAGIDIGYAISATHIEPYKE
jgi:hypothetical protein